MISPKWIGLAVLTIGYGLAIWGAWILYRNPPPDLGEFGSLVPYPEFRRMFMSDDEAVRRVGQRAIQNKRGFGLIAVGCILQLVGTLVSALA